MIETILLWIQNWTTAQAWFWLGLENIILFVGTLIVGHWLVKRFQNQAITEPAEAITPLELMLAASTVFLNTAITVGGWYLWKAGIITLTLDMGFKVILDVFVLFMVMDLAMYIFHRVAHHPWLYPIVHTTHHQFENPRPLTLFVLNPAETLGFGLLWLVVISIYTSSWLGVAIYLGLNLAFGLVGHLGVEPSPERWPRHPILKHISTSTFHAEHHQDKEHNFGFYTLLWDRLFGTLSPDYLSDFNSAVHGEMKVSR